MSLITIISSMVSTGCLADSIQEIFEEFGGIFQLNIYLLHKEFTQIVHSKEFQSIMFNSDIILLDIRGNDPNVEKMLEILNSIKINTPENFSRKTIISLVGGNKEVRELTQMGSFLASKIPSATQDELGFSEIPELTQLVQKGVKMSKMMGKISKMLPIGMFKHIKNWVNSIDYWVYGHTGISENLKHLFLMISKDYLGVKGIGKIPGPKKIPPFGIFDPICNQYFKNLEDYQKIQDFDYSKQTIGIFFYGGIYFEQSIPIIEQFMLQFKDFNIIPLYSETLDNIDAHTQFFFKGEHPLVSAIINLQYFQINGGPFGGNNQHTLNLYKKYNIPQFNPIILFDSSDEDYFNSNEGISPINQVIAVIMPELDGRIEMMSAGFMQNLGKCEETHSNIMEIQPYIKNIEFITERVKKWLKLRRIQNKDKKLGLVIYDYPPGEGNIGNASYLNTISSILSILNILKNEGYTVESEVYNSINNSNEPEKTLKDIIFNYGLINCAEHLPNHQFRGISLDFDNAREIISKMPETLRNEIEQYWDTFPGNIMVDKHSFHLPIMQLGNIYIAIQPARTKKADDPKDYHNTQTPPHYQYLIFYRYLEDVLNLNALVHVGTHGTIEFLPGKECVGNYLDYNYYLLGCLPNIYLYHVTNTSEAAIAKRRINAVIINHKSPPFITSDLYGGYEQLEALIGSYLDLDNDNSNNENKHNRELLNTIREQSTHLNLKFISIENLKNQLYQLKISAIPSGLHIIGNRENSKQKIQTIINFILHNPEAPKFLQNLLEDSNSIPSKLSAIVDKLKNEKEEEEYLDKSFIEITNLFIKFGVNTEEIKELKEFMRKISKKLDDCLELENFIHALEGGFIEPGMGGDPIRNFDVYPTGKNSFGFDPRLIPSTIATERGNIIAKQSLEHYKKANGEYPESIGVVLWGFETMKTGGESIGQILNYIGVKAVKNKSIWTTELEIIPLEEMSHPRINPLITICGIFRDIFPYALNLINHAVKLVANLEEPIDKNFVRKASLNNQEADFKNPDARVFGPAPGKYNTNLTQIINSNSWNAQEELINDYISNLGHIYSEDCAGEFNPSQFSNSLKKVQLISQVRDSSEFDYTDLDHYYEFSGGMKLSIKSLSGSDAEVLVADTSSRKISLKNLQDTITKGVITRNLNPKWIDGMLKHQTHGAQKVSERVENLLGISATTNKVENWVWEKSYETYFEDKAIRERLIENNQFSMMDMIEDFLEAEKRGFWDTDPEHLENLKRLYLELDKWVESNFCK